MFWDVFLVLCANAGKSPNSVCKELGFSNATATHWKNGQQPRTSTLSKISDYFGVSTTYLLSGVDEQKTPHLVDEILSTETLDIISSLLKEQHKTQKELCDFLGVKKNAYTNWKCGQNTSYLKYLPQIAEFLNVSIDFLLGKTEQKKTAPVEQPSDTKIEQLMNDVSGLSESNLDKLLDYVELLKLKQNQ